jgi:GTP-binding protein HflX
MSKKFPEPTVRPKERALLVGVEIQNQMNVLSLEDSLTELSLLANTAGIDVVGQETQKISRPNPKTFIGSGKVEEIKLIAEEVQADIVLFDDELNPRHTRELEELFGLGIRIVDRTALILDIFAQHAASREGRLQVELAQYEYRLPRLTRAWTHLARQAGGGGGRAGSVGGVGLRGPGETQLEVDRREISRRIAHLKLELEKVRTQRRQYRTRRKLSNMPIISFVGYTNAGKSTLLNRLANANIYVADQLFATLDPTTRRVDLASGRQVLLTDTVGFIQKLPTTLVAAFRATLEEISESDFLLHVVDISHPNYQEQITSVDITLQDINASHIPKLIVCNKIDLVDRADDKSHYENQFPESIEVSALSGEGIAELIDKMNTYLYDSSAPMMLKIPKKRNDLVGLFTTQGQIEKIEYLHDFTIIHGSLPVRFVAMFASYIQDEY